MDLESILQNLTELDPAYIRVFLASMRYAAPVLAAVLLLRCLLIHSAALKHQCDLAA